MFHDLTLRQCILLSSKQNNCGYFCNYSSVAINNIELILKVTAGITHTINAEKN
jgi:hypothetical protein